MKPSADLNLPRIPRYVAAKHLISCVRIWAAIATLPSSTVDPNGSPADRHECVEALANLYDNQSKWSSRPTIA